MAATPTPRPTPADPASNPAWAPLRALAVELPLAVAFSGGADSTALLIAAAGTWTGQVHAIHVNHGLQAAASQFEHHCEAVCESLQVPLRVERVDARHASGESPEDAARKARYAALAAAAAALRVKTVLLGQHADDQVETMLLALSRGAGLPGLAAMPASFVRHGVRFRRPLLGVSGAGLREWLSTQGVATIDDPTNQDTAYTRNRIRQQVLPAVAQAFPQFRETFARSARHAAQAHELLTAIAADDLLAVGDPPAIAALQRLTRARQANVLRYWLRAAHDVAPSAAQLDELLDQVADCTTRGHRLRIKVGAGLVQRQGEQLAFTPSV